MARVGDTEAANRYDGVAVGPQYGYTFETQSGQPVDGSNAHLRQLSPFTLRLLPPDALLAAASESSGIDLITAAAQGADRNSEAAQLQVQLASVSPVGYETSELEAFVSSGQFLADVGAQVYTTISDALAAADIAVQVKRILEVPPLTLLINPTEMNVSYTNIQTHATRTRYGFLFERWGEEQPTISFSGSTGAFIAGVAASPGSDPFIDHASGETSSVSGVQYASKRDSAAWQNFVALMHFYKSNGYIYDTVRGTEAHHFIGGIAIDYDQWTYVGHIDSLEFTYDETKPHNVDWSMEFRVGQMYDHATPTFAVMPQTAPTPSPSDPRYSNGMQTGVHPASDIIAALDQHTTQEQDPALTLGVVPFELLE